MSVVYVDTSAFVALLWRRDRGHEAVAAVYRSLRDERARLVTADPVIAETATRLRYDAGLGAALRFHRVIRAATEVATLTIRESDADLRDRAFEVMRRYDGLALSYGDCVGAAVAREVRADVILALDDDFRILGFDLLPG
ncbi:MAG: type II toxin-antitoxin system VapC family toxin [Nitriliruptorales bacterium]